MLVTLSPIIYSLTCEPNIFAILEYQPYPLLTIAFEFNVTEVKPVQSSKAPYPMLVTVLGIVTEVKLLPKKALSPMLVTLYTASL
jgi:hypothetical protein